MSQRQVAARASSTSRPTIAAGLVFADVDVVAALRLGRRREDRLGQPIRFAQSGGQRMPQTLAGLLVSFQPEPDR